MANCQVQVAPAQGKLRPACPGGMHAVVSCVAGPRFRPPKAKPGRKESRTEVGPQGPARRPGGPGPTHKTLLRGEGLTRGRGLSRRGRGGGGRTPHQGDIGSDQEESKSQNG